MEKLANLKVGDLFEVGEVIFIVLEHQENQTKVLSLYEYIPWTFVFGRTNDFNKSEINRILKSETLKFEGKIGSDNIVEHTIALDTLDGQNEFGKWEGKLRIPTFDEARKYNDIITAAMKRRNYSLGNAQIWLCTPWTTRSRDHNEYVMILDAKKGIISKKRSFEKEIMIKTHVVCMLKSHLEVLQEREIWGDEAEKDKYSSTGTDEKCTFGTNAQADTYETISAAIDKLTADWTNEQWQQAYDEGCILDGYESLNTFLKELYPEAGKEDMQKLRHIYEEVERKFLEE